MKLLSPGTYVSVIGRPQALISQGVPIPPRVVQITTPTAGAALTQNTPVTISGTISAAGTVNVYEGAVLLGAATISGLTWTYSWTPQAGDVGAQTINATAVIGGASVNVIGVPVTVAAYNFAADPQLLGRWKAGSLADMSVSGPFGALVATGGAITTTPSVLDGNAVWSFTKGAAVRLLSANLTTIPGPFHFFIVARSTATGGAPALGDVWMSDGGNGTGGSAVTWQDATHIRGTSGGNLSAVCTPTNFNFFNFCFHCFGPSRFCVNGAPYSTANDNVGNQIHGIVLGALNNGTSGAGVDIAEVIVVEGQCSAALIAGITSYMSATYPSLGVAATPPAVFSVDQTVLSLVSAGDDFIILGGQSNMDCNTSAATATAAANTYVFDAGLTFHAMPQVYNAYGGAPVDTTPSRGAGAGGPGTSLLNTYTASTGRRVLACPIMSGGSGMSTAGANGVASNTWERDAVGGRNQHQRNVLYWLAVARVKNLINLGLKFRFLAWYQGEDEAISGQASTHAAITNTFFTNFLADCGLPKRIVVQQIANSVFGATAPNIATIQAGQAGLASAGSVLVTPAWAGAMEGDGLHVVAAGANSIGAAMANAALAQTAGTGWF